MSINLAALRSIQLRYLTDAAEILRYTETSTSDGVTQAWATLASGVPCRVSQSSATGSERSADGAVVRSISDWRIWLPFDQDVTERDRIAVTGVDRTDGRVFEVRRVDEKTNETARRVLCVLLNEGLPS